MCCVLCRHYLIGECLYEASKPNLIRDNTTHSIRKIAEIGTWFSFSVLQKYFSETFDFVNICELYLYNVSLRDRDGEILLQQKKWLLSLQIMIHSLFLINTSGDVFLEKHWKSVISRSVVDYFFDAQNKAANNHDIPPVIATPHHYLISIYR